MATSDHYKMPTISVFVIKFTMAEFIPSHEIELQRQPIIDAIEDYLTETDAYQRQELYLLICPCFQVNTPSRCSHLQSLMEYPYIPIPYCLRVGELDWFELTQPFWDQYSVNLLWRCEIQSCKREFCCGTSPN